MADAHTWHERSLPHADGSITVTSVRRIGSTGAQETRKAVVAPVDNDSHENHLRVVEDCHDIELRQALGG